MLVNQLNDYIQNLGGNGAPPYVVAGNIGLSSALGGNQNHMNDMIVLSLVNMIEEATLKNVSAYRPSSLLPELENPPVYLNLYFLFTANFIPGTGATSTDHTYLNGITRLTHVVEFFQGKTVFSVQNSPTSGLLPDPIEVSPPLDLQELSIKMEMVSLTFEQVNYLWGSLGGKQLPFVLYKAHVLPITRRSLTGRGAPIQDIQTVSLGLSNTES